MKTSFKDTFRGKVVNKKLTVNTGVDEFPRFVVEYLIDNYCTEENFQADLQQVIKRLRENSVHGAEAEKIRHQIRETRSHSIIANLEVRLQETEDKYWGTISAINESFVNVTESLVRQYPMLLSGGVWGTITLTYDETEIHNKKIRPFKVTEFTPFQISVIDLDEYIDKRRQFEADEWLDILINSVGLNPDHLSRREKLLYVMRLVPLVEAFIDRLHSYLPGWEIPKIHPGSLAQDYGFITDYFCEIMHELRRKDLLGSLKGRYQLMDTSTAQAGITGRDVRGVEKILSGLLKLMYPHGELTDLQLGELLSLAIEGRQRVRNQLHLMAPGEYGPVVLSGKLTQSGKTITPRLPDNERLQMGKVLGIGGVLPKLQAAIDAGCKEVIMPKENERDVQMTPEYVRTKINVRFVTSIDEVLASALLSQTV